VLGFRVWGLGFRDWAEVIASFDDPAVWKDESQSLPASAFPSKEPQPARKNPKPKNCSTIHPKLYKTHSSSPSPPSESKIPRRPYTRQVPHRALSLWLVGWVQGAGFRI
jgi:hypothetical protein